MNWLQRFMYGRYGVDPLGIALLVLYMVLSMIGAFWHSAVYALLILIFPLIILLRFLSRNIDARKRENDWFVSWFPGFKDRAQGTVQSAGSWWQRKQQQAQKKAADRANYRYFTCPKCRQKLRLPRGRGKIEITCPKCQHQFVKKT